MLKPYALGSAKEPLVTYPSPNPTLTLTCRQLTAIELVEGQGGSCLDTDIDPSCQDTEIDLTFE